MLSLLYPQGSFALLLKGGCLVEEQLYLYLQPYAYLQV